MKRATRWKPATKSMLHEAFHTGRWVTIRKTQRIPAEWLRDGGFAEYDPVARAVRITELGKKAYKDLFAENDMRPVIAFARSFIGKGEK